MGVSLQFMKFALQSLWCINSAVAGKREKRGGKSETDFMAI
jgi:hypothetical protein